MSGSTIVRAGSHAFAPRVAQVGAASPAKSRVFGGTGLAHPGRMLCVRFAIPCLVVSLSLAVGCGSKVTSTATTSGATCSYSGAIPKAPSSKLTGGGFGYGSPPQGVSVQAYAEANGLAYLDAFVGSYLRGDSTVYTGTLSAEDNQSVLGTDCNGGSQACHDQSIASGPAVASLAVASGEATLTVHSLGAHKYVVFSQSHTEPDVTTVGIVLPDTGAGGNTGTCSGCAPSFLKKPASIDVQNLVSTAYVAVNPGVDAGPGVVDDAGIVVDAYAGVPLDTHASTSLTLATACDLTFDDLVELNSLGPPSTSGSSGQTSYNFVARGDQMVAVVQGSVYTYSEDAGTGCTTAYSIELYVSTTNLADYGVQNYTVVHPDAGYYQQYCK